MGTRIAYYSKTGNNRALALKLASAIGAELDEIRPALPAMFFQMVFTAAGRGPGAASSLKEASDPEELILVAPLWMGSLAWPARAYLRSNGKSARVVHVVTCCGSDDSVKDDKFGYASALSKVRESLGERAGSLTSLPSVLALPADKRAGEDAAMAARLTQDSFSGEVASRLESIVADIKAHRP